MPGTWYSKISLTSNMLSSGPERTRSKRGSTASAGTSVGGTPFILNSVKKGVGIEDPVAGRSGPLQDSVLGHGRDGAGKSLGSEAEGHGLPSQLPGVGIPPEVGGDV